MQLPSPTSRLMLALLVGIVAVPVTSTAIFIQQQATDTLRLSPMELYHKAAEDRRRVRAQTRIYWNAIDQFQRKQEQGIAVTKPDINDPDSIDRVFSATDETVTETVTSISTDKLDERNRMLLQLYTRAGFCPDTLTRTLGAAFHKLCVSIVGNDARTTPITGFINDNVYIRRTLRGAASDLPPFKLRLQMLKEAMDPSTRRDGGQLPGRPTVCVMNKDCLTPRSNN